MASSIEQEITDSLGALDLGRIRDGQVIFDELMNPFPTTLGKAISKKEREELHIKDQTLTYGEVTFESLATVIEKIKKIYGKPDVGDSGYLGFLQQRGGVFYDLGSGTGKGIIAAAIAHEFSTCVGIEVMEGLFTISQDVLAAYNSKGKVKLSRDYDANCIFLLGDFLNIDMKDWRDGDVVFANSTCYDDNLMEKISKIAVGMKKGSFFISLTKRLPVADFVVLEHEMCPMSWGNATIYIMQKTTEPRDLVQALDSDHES